MPFPSLACFKYGDDLGLSQASQHLGPITHPGATLVLAGDGLPQQIVGWDFWSSTLQKVMFHVFRGLPFSLCVCSS